MTPKIVLDASLLLKRVLDEPDAEAVRSWFNDNESARFFAPALLFAETGRALQKQSLGATGPALRDLHARLLRGVRLVGPSDGIWEFTGGLTFYDAHYVQLARDLGASLASSDDSMRSAAQRLGIAVAEIPP